MQPNESACPFCTLEKVGPTASNELAAAFPDAYPISPGHTLIIPRRHVASFFDLESAEQSAMLELAKICQERLSATLHPTAFNLGVNDGPAAGQTVMHCHMHLIPRYDGDVDDPRGGIRWVIPAKAPYWDDEPHE